MLKLITCIPESISDLNFFSEYCTWVLLNGCQMRRTFFFLLLNVVVKQGLTCPQQRLETVIIILSLYNMITVIKNVIFGVCCNKWCKNDKLNILILTGSFCQLFKKMYIQSESVSQREQYQQISYKRAIGAHREAIITSSVITIHDLHPCQSSLSVALQRVRSGREQRHTASPSVSSSLGPFHSDPSWHLFLMVS